MANADLTLYKKQYNDAILDAYIKMDAPLFNVVSKVPQQAERQLFDIVTGVADGYTIKRSYDTNLGEGDFYNTKYSNVSAIRVVNYLTDMNWATLITDYDKVRMVSDPTGIFVKAAMTHLKNAQQKIIFQAIENPPKILKTKPNSTAFEEVDGEPVKIVEGTSIEVCLKKAKTQFDAKGVNEDERFLICSAEVRDALLDNDKVSNSLFANALGANSSNGSLKNILGCNVINYEPASSGNTLGYLVQKEALRLGVNKDKLVARIDTLPERNYATQIFIPFSLGASRVNDAGVIKLVKKDVETAKSK